MMKLNKYAVGAFQDKTSVVLTVRNYEYTTLVTMNTRPDGSVYVEAAEESVQPGWGASDYDGFREVQFEGEANDPAKVVADVLKLFPDFNDDQVAYVTEVVNFAFGK